jgi:hypothetical protein
MRAEHKYLTATESRNPAFWEKAVLKSGSGKFSGSVNRNDLLKSDFDDPVKTGKELLD